MLNPRLITCIECDSISTLIENIDCKVANLGTTLYNNLVFMLNKPVSAESFIDLLNYRRILQYKYGNIDYLPEYTIEMIASKVKRLTVGSKCSPCGCDDSMPTTTTTTTILPD